MSIFVSKSSLNPSNAPEAATILTGLSVAMEESMLLSRELPKSETCWDRDKQLVQLASGYVPWLQNNAQSSVEKNVIENLI